MACLADADLGQITARNDEYTVCSAEGGALRNAWVLIPFGAMHPVMHPSLVSCYPNVGSCNKLPENAQQLRAFG